MRRIRIATRASKLALAQADIVATSLKKIDPTIEVSLVTVSTKGDRDRRDFLHKAETQGLFTSEVQAALRDNRADLAVHSFKDMPTAPEPGLVVAAVPLRQTPADALVASEIIRSLDDLPPRATVGTSSLRRIAQLRHFRSDLECRPLRGNVETRLSKVASGAVDAAIVACAGLVRLGLSERISAVLAPDDFIPAPAQGALAIQIRADDHALARLVSQVNDVPSRLTAETERHVLACMHGGCSIPLGVYAQIREDTIVIHALISDADGTRRIKLSRSAPVQRAAQCAEQTARDLLAAGGRRILDEIRNPEHRPES
jgi:hydroxymethylbilane synthase